jgi:cellobiose phosphorylase
MRYQVEPFVVAADVYAAVPHTGRGGWTWYTGSAAWMYRVAVETILGFELRGNRLRLHPCIPADWPEFELTYRRGGSAYKIIYRSGPRAARPQIWVDGKLQGRDEITLTDDGQSHEIVFDCAMRHVERSLADEGTARSAASRVG